MDSIKKKRTWLWIIVATAVIATIIIAVILYRKAQAKKALQNATKPDLPTPNNAPEFKEAGGNRPQRNNNPFNLRLTTLAWTGKVPKDKNTDGSFEQFYERKYGVRAGLKNILNKVAKGQNTISKLITAYAPPHENDTAGYIAKVAAHLGIMPNVPLEADKPTMLKLGSIIAKVEGSPLTDDELSQAYDII